MLLRPHTGIAYNRGHIENCLLHAGGGKAPIPGTPPLFDIGESIANFSNKAEHVPFGAVI